MQIKFSRHAKRRAQLYKVPEAVVTGILSNVTLREGNHEITRDVLGFGYPLKLVISVQQNVATVITVYPLKKGRRK